MAVPAISIKLLNESNLGVYIFSETKLPGTLTPLFQTTSPVFLVKLITLQMDSF